MRDFQILNSLYGLISCIRVKLLLWYSFSTNYVILTKIKRSDEVGFNSINWNEIKWQESDLKLNTVTVSTAFN